MLAKLGGLTLSPNSILGPNAPFSGINLTSAVDDLIPDLGGYLEGVLEAKNELFHLCQEVEESGAEPPSVEDVIAMIQEDVFGAQGDTSAETSRRLRSRRKLRAKYLSHAQHTRHQRRRALRAHHLPRTKFTRPRPHSRRLAESGDLVADLIDGLAVEGGYDGEILFIRTTLDISKTNLELDDIKTLLLSPLERFNEVDFLAEVFDSSDSSESLPFVDTVSVDSDFNAGAHLSVLVGFEITASELLNILDWSAGEIANRTFIQFEDASAKFSVSAKVSGSLDLAGITELNMDEGAIAFAFGIGIEEASPRIYFNQIASALLSLRQNATWVKVGAMDISLPVVFDLGIANLPTLEPILSISDGNLFDTEAASVSFDFNVA